MFKHYITCNMNIYKYKYKKWYQPDISYTLFMDSAATLFLLDFFDAHPSQFCGISSFQRHTANQSFLWIHFLKGAPESSWIYAQNLEWAFLFRAFATFIYQKEHFKLGMFDVCAKFDIFQEKAKIMTFIGNFNILLHNLMVKTSKLYKFTQIFIERKNTRNTAMLSLS